MHVRGLHEEILREKGPQPSHALAHTESESQLFRMRKAIPEHQKPEKTRAVSHREVVSLPGESWKLLFETFH